MDYYNLKDLKTNLFIYKLRLNIQDNINNNVPLRKELIKNNALKSFLINGYNKENINFQKLERKFLNDVYFINQYIKKEKKINQNNY